MTYFIILETNALYFKINLSCIVIDKTHGDFHIKETC